MEEMPLRLSGALTFLIALAMSAVHVTDVSANQRERVKGDIDACREDPRFNTIGGAMIGNCLLEKADQVEAETRLMLRDQAKAYCRADERKAFVQTQAQWQSYRDGWCGIVADSPGNTPAYVNAMACRLTSAQDRRRQLQSLDDHGLPNCPFFKLDKQAGHFGDPAGMRMQIRATSSFWQMEKGSAGTIQLVRADANGNRPLGDIDVSACAFCDPKAEDCDDGVFGLESRLTQNKENYLFFACHMSKGGRLLELHRVSETQPPERVWRVEQADGFDWQLDVEHLRVIPPNGPVMAWPARQDQP